MCCLTQNGALHVIGVDGKAQHPPFSNARGDGMSLEKERGEGESAMSGGGRAGVIGLGQSPSEAGNSERLLPLPQFRRPHSESPSERLGALETRAVNSRLDSILELTASILRASAKQTRLAYDGPEVGGGYYGPSLSKTLHLFPAGGRR